MKSAHLLQSEFFTRNSSLNSMETKVKVLFALTLVHFTGDFDSSFTSPLFPLFVEKLGLSFLCRRHPVAAILS
ncbi:MAG: hypothetical protein V2B19_26100 [Pseudomonadota bacterium]